MYICDFSRSVGAVSATTRNTRGLTRSVIALMVPPLPAVSRPSKTMQTFAPDVFTHSCIPTSSPWRRRNSCWYSFSFIFGAPSELEPACCCSLFCCLCFATTVHSFCASHGARTLQITVTQHERERIAHAVPEGEHDGEH